MASLRGGDGKSLFDGRKMWFFFAAAAAVISAGVIFSVLSAVSGTSSYWMVKEGVTISARQPITEDMLTEVTVPRESAPKNIITLSEITSAISTAGTEDDFYAMYSLKEGDIITTSNAATLSGVANVELPKGTVLASFKANPSAAAGGMVKEGALIDIAVVYQIGSEFFAQYILSQVPVVKATSDLDGSGGAAEGAVTGSPLGAPVLYTVAVTPEQAAALAVASKYSIYVTLTSGSVKNVAGTGSSLADALAGILSTGAPATNNSTTEELNPDGTPVTPTPTPTDETSGSNG
jgi:hypothetical protein